MITYRPEIDGLRAVAVMSVIFGHAGFELFSGGFVGVDIFRHKWMSEVKLGRFSCGSFHQKCEAHLLPTQSM